MGNFSTAVKWNDYVIKFLCTAKTLQRAGGFFTKGIRMRGDQETPAAFVLIIWTKQKCSQVAHERCPVRFSRMHFHRTT